MTITWTSSIGNQISAEIVGDKVKVVVDQKFIGTALAPVRAAMVGGDLRLALERARRSHVLLVNGPKKTPVGIDEKTANAIYDAIKSSPKTLEELRESLASEKMTAMDAWGAAREAAFAAGGDGWDRVKTTESKVVAAEEALAGFDAAHPEIVAAVDTERKAATERFMDAD